MDWSFPANYKNDVEKGADVQPTYLTTGSVMAWNVTYQDVIQAPISSLAVMFTVWNES
jgi:hypothetical protein